MVHPAEKPEIEPEDALEARAERRRWAVDVMIQVGAAMGQRLRAEVEAVDDAKTEGAAQVSDAMRLGGRDPALAYSRIFRAVRLGVALGERLDNPDWAPAPQRERRGGRAAADDGPADDKPDYDEIVRSRFRMRGEICASTIGRVVESLIETEVESDVGGERCARLLEAFYERLDDEEELEAIGSRSIGESIALICADLGISPDWRDWRLEEWAIRETNDQTPGSPFGRPRPPWPRRSGRPEPPGWGAGGAGFDADASRPAQPDDPYCNPPISSP